ncbi:Uncharacterised protein [Mycobacteroides abscessus subsp. abscessus]|nr:Uncharacterised protein [Mycobacteroides abscessus subsp. abscessus]
MLEPPASRFLSSIFVWMTGSPAACISPFKRLTLLIVIPSSFSSIIINQDDFTLIVKKLPVRVAAMGGCMRMLFLEVYYGNRFRKCFSCSMKIPC